MYSTIINNIYTIAWALFLYKFLTFYIVTFLPPYWYECYEYYDYQYIKNTGITYGYNIIYGISCCQIYGVKIYKIIKPSITFIKKQYLVIEDELLLLFASKPSATHIDYYNNGIKVCTTDTNISPTQLTNVNFKPFPEIKYDYIVIKHKANPDSITVDKLCLQYYPTNTGINWDMSNIKFLSLQLEYNNAQHHIYLSTNEYNYYIQNAIIDKQFINYYLQNVLQENVTDKDEKYTLHVVDNDVKLHILTEMDSIIINKDDYTIKIGNDN